MHFLIELAKAEILLIEPSYHVLPIPSSSRSELSLIKYSERCVTDLCEMKDSINLGLLALSIAVQAEAVARGNVEGDMLPFFDLTSGVFRPLAMAIAGVANLCASSNYGASQKSRDLSFYPSAASAVRQGGDCEKQSLLAVLLDVLAVQDRGYPSGNWALHMIAIKQVLTRRAQVDSLPGPLLDALFTSYLGLAFSADVEGPTTANVFHSCKGNPASLIKFLMSRGYLKEAGDFAIMLLQRLSYSKPVWVPYSLFDELIGQFDEDQTEAVSALTAAIEAHFQNCILAL